MAGTIQADFLQPQSGAGLMVLTPSGNTIATLNTSGVYTSTGALAINSLGQVSNTQISGLITSGQIATVANTQVTGTIAQSQLGSNVVGNGPAFSAYRATNQTPTAATWVKLIADTEEFDTNSNFDSTTNYRFQPTVAGYYQMNAGIMTGGAGGVGIALYKNGTTYKYGSLVALPSGALASSFTTMVVSSVIFCNGSTDYVECYGYNSAGAVFQGLSTQCYFNGAMVRSA